VIQVEFDSSPLAFLCVIPLVLLMPFERASPLPKARTGTMLLQTTLSRRKRSIVCHGGLWPGVFASLSSQDASMRWFPSSLKKQTCSNILTRLGMRRPDWRLGGQIQPPRSSPRAAPPMAARSKAAPCVLSRFCPSTPRPSRVSRLLSFDYLTAETLTVMRLFHYPAHPELDCR
jgi:hypothetical protein